MVSLATETKGGQILVAFLPKHGLRSDLRVSNLKEFSWGNMPPDFPSLYTLIHHQLPYRFKIAGSGPAYIQMYSALVLWLNHCLCSVLKHLQFRILVGRTGGTGQDVLRSFYPVSGFSHDS